MDKNNLGTGQKFVLLLIVVVLIYLAFFQFNIQEAYNYTVQQDSGFFK